jgi:hypothetical protein
MYKIVGADQKEYGPATEEQVRQWITDGRANAQTIARFEDGPWKPLSTFPEFASALGKVPPPMPPLTGPAPSPLSMPGAGAAPATSGMAVGGLVCSILGLFCCGPLLSTVGLVLGVLALTQINQNPTRYTGKNLATAAIVVALIGYTLFAVLFFTGFLKRAFRRFPHYI